MAKEARPDINLDDYLDTELGYDMPVNTKAVPAAAEKGVLKKKQPDVYNPGDFSEVELGYEYEAGQEALE